EVLPLTEDIVQKTIMLRKQYRIKLPDAIIAATALHYDLQLITRNFDDFKQIKGLTYLDAHNQ
ncbi:MAG: type II toxin-antitoxin system VapC family toxin, partial [Bacteroidota bacterium]